MNTLRLKLWISWTSHILYILRLLVSFTQHYRIVPTCMMRYHFHVLCLKCFGITDCPWLLLLRVITYYLFVFLSGALKHLITHYLIAILYAAFLGIQLIALLTTCLLIYRAVWSRVIVDCCSFDIKLYLVSIVWRDKILPTKVNHLLF